jgi:hypothetical protein
LTHTGAKATIASSADASAIGLDLDLENLGVLLEASRSKGQATARATGLVRRQDKFLCDGGQVRVVPAVGEFAALLLTPGPRHCRARARSRRRGGGRGGILSDRIDRSRSLQVIGRVTRFRLGAKETLLEGTDGGVGQIELGLKESFTFTGAYPQAMVVASKLASLEELGQVRTVGATKTRKRSKEIG